MKPLLCLLVLGFCLAPLRGVETTTVSVDIPETPPRINPAIYGQMLEPVNDRVVYDGVVGVNGKVRERVVELLRPLQSEVMRWPGGTYVLQYDWRKGIGPWEQRRAEPNLKWGGTDPHLFGTAEFIQWSRRIGVEPYINVNMGNHPEHGASLIDALEWIEYVNGSVSTPMGRLRAEHGHPQPWNVRYWGLGNENWGWFGTHKPETADAYGARLAEWSRSIRERHPDLVLIGVGWREAWNATVLEKAGRWIDILTEHYYVASRVRDGKLIDPLGSLMAPTVFEEHLRRVGKQVDAINRELGREGRPIRLAIDEWNNRRTVYGDGKYTFSRHDPRRQFDAAVVAGVLNVFIRQSPRVGMANYIFPVNGHGVIRTLGDDDAFTSTLYPVFLQYRRWMSGRRIDVAVAGPGVPTVEVTFRHEGDAREAERPTEPWLTWVDSAATLGDDGVVTVALVNRSPTETQAARVELPAGYRVKEVWMLASGSIDAANTAEDRQRVVPQLRSAGEGMKNGVVELPPCSVALVRAVR